MKKYVLMFLSLGSFAGIHAQTDSLAAPKIWKTDFQSGINMNQASFSDNWKSGGVNSIALSTFLNAKAVRRTDVSDWTNELQLQYGNINNKGEGIRKSADRIFFESKYAYRLTKVWNAFASVSFMSQFDAGFDYKKGADGGDSVTRISGFMSPAYLTEALGVEYKPVEYFSAQLGVGALRQTFVTDQSLYARAGATELYGVPVGDKMRNQIVFQLVANFDKEIMTNVRLKARYMALADYEKLNGQGIVHRVDASVVMKVNRFISTNVSGVLLYDYDQDKDVQYSEILAIGILYTFTNHPEDKK